jgi:hypothetical protein
VTPYDHLCTGRQQHCKLPAVSRGRRALFQVERGVPKEKLEQRKGGPKEKQSPAQQFCPIGHGTAVWSEQDPAVEHTVGLQTAVCVINQTQLSAVSCCSVRLTLVCATGKQPAEILIETFRFHATESFVST